MKVTAKKMRKLAMVIKTTKEISHPNCLVELQSTLSFE